MESKILRGGEGAVQLSYFMSLVLNGLFKMLFDCLSVCGYRCFWSGCGGLLNFFEVLGNACRWF